MNSSCFTCGRWNWNLMLSGNITFLENNRLPRNENLMFLRQNITYNITLLNVIYMIPYTKYHILKLRGTCIVYIKHHIKHHVKRHAICYQKTKTLCFLANASCFYWNNIIYWTQNITYCSCKHHIKHHVKHNVKLVVNDRPFSNWNLMF
jgi:hypothetical protein